MKLSPSQQIVLKVGVASLAIGLWIAWLVVALYPFSGESSEVIQLSWYVALTLSMTTVGIVGMTVTRISSSVWNLVQAMSLAIPVHLLALMAESRGLAITALSISGVPVIVLSLLVLREVQLERVKIRQFR